MAQGSKHTVDKLSESTHLWKDYNNCVYIPAVKAHTCDIATYLVVCPGTCFCLCCTWPLPPGKRLHTVNSLSPSSAHTNEQADTQSHNF